MSRASPGQIDPQSPSSAWTSHSCHSKHRRADSSGTNLSPVPGRSSRSLFSPPTFAPSHCPSVAGQLVPWRCSPICSTWLGSWPRAGALAPLFEWSLWDKATRLGALWGHGLYLPTRLGSPWGQGLYLPRQIEEPLKLESVPPSSGSSLSEGKNCNLDAVGKAYSFLSIGTPGGGLCPQPCTHLGKDSHLDLSVPISNGVNIPSGL